MIKIHSFHGGIHPPENKKQSTRADIDRCPLPKILVVPTQQHIGMPADPIVKVGQKVLKGELIAESVGRISASIHAPTSGTVIEISEQPVPHASGLTAECIVIESDGADQWIEHEGLSDYREIERSELVSYIHNKGIAGMGGAGFPTDVKLNLSHDHIVNTLIINAAECEPYITADDMLMREHADEVIKGIEIIAHLLTPSHIIIGIEDNKPNAIRALNLALTKTELAIDLAVVPTKYPSGGERQLIQLLTGVEVPSGKIPADVGIVVQNVGTTRALHRAVAFGEPLIERIVTVTGNAVAHPRNFHTLIGTPFADLLKAADLDEDALFHLVMGGPMMGVGVDNQAIPVIKTTNCIIAASESEMPESPAAQACIRCGMCEQACPAQLLPQQLYWFAKGNEFEKAKNHNLFDCIECGACAYVCPSSIPLVQFYRYAKSEIRAEQVEQRKADHARARFEARNERLEREAIEKAERRKARAAEAAKTQAARKAAAEKGETATDAPAIDAKALKTAAAVARTKLKKAEKALATAIEQELSETELQQLRTEVEQAAQRADEAEKALAAGEIVSTTPDDKALKIAAASARTKLKKAEDALKSARDKGLEGLEKLEATVAKLKAAADEAESAYAAVQEASANSASTADTSQTSALSLKDLKQQVSIMRTKLKKAESNDPIDEAEVETFKTRLNEATTAFETADNQLIELAAKDGIDLKQLRIDVALAKVTVTKLDRAIAKSEDEAEQTQLTTELESAKQSFAELESTLNRYE